MGTRTGIKSLSETIALGETLIHKFPELKFDDRVMISSLENQHLIIQMLIRHGLKKNKHWILYV